MSALEDVIQYHADNCQSGSECDLSALSRAELTALRAENSELKEHDARMLEKCDVCGCELICDVLEGDDEYSDPYCPKCLCDELRSSVAALTAERDALEAYTTGINIRLAANAPQAETRRATAECPCVAAEKPVRPCSYGCWHFAPYDSGHQCVNCGQPQA